MAANWHKGEWIKGVAHWREGNAAFISVAFTWRLPEARQVAADKVAAESDAWHQFKNFHRLLCERFGYCHDPKDWVRDQVSLIEHIAALGAGSAPEWTREDLAVGLAALDGIVLRRIKSTVGPADDANSWREYLGRADDLMAHLSAAPGEAP